MTFGEVEDIPRGKRRRKLKRILEKCTGRNPKQNATRSCKKCFTTKSKPPQRMHAGTTAGGGSTRKGILFFRRIYK